MPDSMVCVYKETLSLSYAALPATCSGGGGQWKTTTTLNALFMYINDGQ